MKKETLLILEKALKGERISDSEALYLFLNANLHDLGKCAQSIRNKMIPEKKVSYTAFRIINYTDICTIDCSFCSFKKPEDSDKGYIYSIEQILEKADSAISQGADQFFIQGGVNPQIPFSYYTGLLTALKSRYPDSHIRAFSPVEILSMSRQNNMSIYEILKKLQSAGMDSIPGAGAEILTERMRKILSEKKCSTHEWYEIMHTALSPLDKGGLNMKGSTNIVWGSSETSEEIIEHLSIIRKLQDETGNVCSFVPWTFQRQTNSFPVREVSSIEYLKLLALSRIYLDNVPNIEVSLLVKGRDIGQVALHYGANDINSPVFEENVLRSYGLKSIAEAENFIKESGFIPVRRNLNFEHNKY